MGDLERCYDARQRQGGIGSSSKSVAEALVCKETYESFQSSTDGVKLGKLKQEFGGERALQSSLWQERTLRMGVMLMEIMIRNC